ncbi:MAG TPA: helix-turn-helix transcriptional regulator [Pseudonocardiaceae bacterium]|jgi:transcriptional regulator with XRE-family HTH domain/tetratricopeptide (TPR) repeat protein|nr:helix-turn-helix transcriptional regulator [Pseudonocardiaceae bacterium]
MNVTGPQDHPVSPDTWEEPEMRRVLVARDVSSVYRMLRRVGISQRQIAALTGQSQSEVSEILKGRQVMAYDVLARISDGLGIPRGYMGLAYDAETATSVAGPPDDAKAEEDESVKRRKLLAHGAAVMFGTTVFGAEKGEWQPGAAQTPAPSQIGMTDVKQVEAATRAMRDLDYQFGGGACRDAVVAQLSWAQRLLSASGNESVRKRLFRALGDLQNLAGWTTFDVGLLDSARTHFAKALEFAKESGDAGLLSNIMYRIGRIYLHRNEPNDALKWFQLGQIAAQESGSELAVAVLCANEAWAYAMMNDSTQAKKLLGRARDELARADPNDVPDWARFFNDTDMQAMTGSVYTELSIQDPGHSALAIPALIQALAGYTEAMSRSRAFTLTALATNYLRQGEVDHGVRIGRDVLLLANGLKSARVTDRLGPLEDAAVHRSSSADARELAQVIRQYRGRNQRA